MSHILQVPGYTHPHGHGSDKLVHVCTVYKLWVSSLSFQLLAEVYGPAEADDNKIIMVKSCIAYNCTNISESGLNSHKIPCNEERQKLWFIALWLLKPFLF